MQGKLPNVKKHEIITNHYKEQIENKTLSAGTRLPSIEQLASEHKVGRSVIREALSTLRALGYIDIKHGDGTFVSSNQPNLSDITSNHTTSNHTHSGPMNMNSSDMTDHSAQLDFFEMRRILEAGAVALAAKRRTDGDLHNLRDILKDMLSATESKQEELAEMADTRFHLAIAMATHNHLMIHLMNQMSDQMQNTMKESRMLWIFAEQSTMERLYQEHVSIFEAIVDSNPSLAEALMLSHLGKVEKRLHEGHQ